MGAVRKLQPMPRVQQPKRPVQRTKKNKKVDYIRFDTRRYRISKHIAFTTVLIFAMGIGAVWSFAYLQDMRQQIDRQRVLLQQQHENNILARAEITRHVSIEEVARIAEERLNMSRPDPSQIVFINVPRPSYVVQSDAPSVLEQPNMWQAAVQYMRNWLGV